MTITPEALANKMETLKKNLGVLLQVMNYKCSW